MKKKHFYSHLIETDSIAVALGNLNMSDEERLHLIALIDSSLHHTVLDAILSELSEEDKITFLTHVSDEDHSKVWNHLNTKVDNIEDKIIKAAEELKKDLHKDIQDIK